MKHMNRSRLSVLYVLIVMEGLSMIGTRMTSMSLGIWLYHATQQTTPILWIALFNELPAMLAGNIAGIWVDRLPKRIVLLLSDAGQAVGSALLMVSLALGFFNLPLLYAVVFFQGICAMFQSPAAQTVTAMMTSEEQRDRVNGIREMLFPLAGIISPAIVGLLYEPLGIAGIVIVDGITFLASAIFLLSVRLPDEEKKELDMDRTVRTPLDVFSGITFLFRHRWMGLIVYIMIMNFLLNGTLEMVVPYASEASGENGWSMSFILMSMNAGALAGAFIVAGIGRFRNRIKALMAGYAVTGLMYFAFGTAKDPIWLGVALFLLMMPLPAGGALLSSHFQSAVPAALHGRVFAFLHQMYVASAVLSFTVLGPFVDRVLQPAVEAGALSWLLPIVGDRPASGIAVLYMAAGIVMTVVTIMAIMLYRRRTG